MALCTRDDVKEYLEIPDQETGKDYIIDSLIPAAQNFVEEYCNRVFDKTELTEYHTGGGNRIFLKRFPVDLDEDFTVWDSSDRTYTDDDKIDSDDYFVDDASGIIMFDVDVGGYPGSIKVTYTAGYDAADIPAAVKFACVELVARKVREGPQGQLGVPQRYIPQGGNVVFVIDDILPQTKTVLDTFRKPAYE